MSEIINIENSDLTKASYGVSGMTCASCAISLETYLSAQKGVEEVSVNYPNQSVSISYGKSLITLDKLKSAANEIGYGIITDKDQNTAESKEKLEAVRLKSLRQKLIVASAFSIPVFVLAMFFPKAIPGEHWVMMLLSVPVLFWSGSEFFVNAWKKAKHLTANMDSLVALSTGVAFVFGVFNTVYPEYFLSRGLEPHVYFESAVVIVSLILLGRFLEERAKSRTSQAIKKLVGLQPKEVWVIRNGSEERISIDEVILGDLLLIKPGDKVPVDGKVSSGNSFIDESMITGEPIAVNKKKGVEVFAGTINQKGSLQIIASKVGDETLLAQIIKLVQEAQSSKPPIQKLVDKVAGIFVPVVIVIALIAAGVWYFAGPEPSLTYSILILITVLIVACPCALGLATPTALMVGIGKGAQHGILIKDAQSLEVAYKMNALVLDKTGTITHGKPQVTDVVWVDAKQEGFLKSILMSLEALSEHPIAEAIWAKLKDEGVTKVAIEDFISLTGRGAKAKHEGQDFFVGNERLIDEHGINIDPKIRARATELSIQAKTTVYLADSHQVLGIIAVADEIKKSSKNAIQELKRSGVEVYMLTGDNEHTASAIARATGIDHYKSQVMPADKGNFVKELQAQGFVVGMAGDGINDSHALAQADIGIAMGTGTDIAMESAGITLMKSDLQQIASAIRLSKGTIRTIRQNLFWAFIYNIIAIPVAAGVLYPAFGFLLNPMIAGGAMALSSVSVISNSLRLKRVKI